MLRVRLPAARLHLVAVDAPENELLLEQRPANTLGIVQLARPIVVEDLRKDARITVEVILVRRRVIIGECVRETRKASSRNLLENMMISLKSPASNIQNDAVHMRPVWHQ